MSEKNNRNIPRPIQREVHQRCGYGCVICGYPLCDYHHMKGWAKTKEHVSEEIVLLCKNHHGQVTTGILPDRIVAEHNENPFNLKQGYSTDYQLYFEGNICELVIGGNSFQNSYKGETTFAPAIMVDGITLFGFTLENNRLLLNVLLFDENNFLVLRIDDNILTYSTDIWDVEFVGRKLIIREKHRKLLICMNFEPPNKVVIENARLLCNGVEILVKNEQLIIGNKKVSIMGGKFKDNGVGIRVGANPYQLGAGVGIGHINRYSQQSEYENLIEKILEND